MAYSEKDTSKHSSLSRESILNLIKHELQVRRQTVSQAIAERELYFRVSTVGVCNLRCLHCHNEGAPATGKLDLDFGVKAMVEAFNIGFRRVQFTGGEPLLHPQIVAFVREGKRIFGDAGITTNGTYLEEKLESLVYADITRIHISLQTEALRDASSKGQWRIPSWLASVSKLASDGHFLLRLNLPISVDEILGAERFLENISSLGCDIKIFSIIPQDPAWSVSYPIKELESLARIGNERRTEKGLNGRISVRGYKSPEGIRCTTCEALYRCKELSRSLRLGADRILRPCLATREWDVLVTEENVKAKMEESTLLALDYLW